MDIEGMRQQIESLAEKGSNASSGHDYRMEFCAAFFDKGPARIPA